MRWHLSGNLTRLLLSFIVSSLLLVLLCSLVQATEAEPGCSAATSRETDYPRLLDSRTAMCIGRQIKNLVPGLSLGRDTQPPDGRLDHWVEDGPGPFLSGDHGVRNNVAARIGRTRFTAERGLRTPPDWVQFKPGGCKILLHPPSAEKVGQPGYLVEYGLSLENAGVCDGIADLAAKSSRSWNIDIAPSMPPYTLDSGESKWLTVTLEVPLHVSGGTMDVTWVTATLTCGLPYPTTATDLAEITTTVTPISLTDVKISGPTEGYVSATYAFTAAANPVTANRPITYTWWATDQAQVEAAIDSPSHTVFFTWSIAGVKTIRVVAANVLSTCTDTHYITITPRLQKMYLPLVLRCCPLGSPRLYPIDNRDIDGDYTVCWDYPCSFDFFLEEATDSAFTDGKIVYSGPDKCHSFSGKDPGWYYYRVKTCHNGICGDWSPSDSTSAWMEQEDNNNCENANGPLISGSGYYGYPDDPADCFKIHLQTAGAVAMELDNHKAGGAQLQLWDHTGTKLLCRDWTRPLEKTCHVFKGGYCIRIKTTSGYTTGISYTLQARFP